MKHTQTTTAIALISKANDLMGKVDDKLASSLKRALELYQSDEYFASTLVDWIAAR